MTDETKTNETAPTDAETQALHDQLIAQYSGDDDGGYANPDDAPAFHGTEEPIHWTATEFVAHQKSMNWYLALTGVIAVLAFIAFWLTPDPISSAVIVICGILFGVYAGHKPRELEYSIDSATLTIGSRHFPLAQFRSFTVVKESVATSITLLPLKRFAPALTLYFDPEDEQPIVDTLSQRLPLEDRSHDPVDRLMRRIRF
jgi:hypothetical protein